MRQSESICENGLDKVVQFGLYICHFLHLGVTDDVASCYDHTDAVERFRMFQRIIFCHHEISTFSCFNGAGDVTDSRNLGIAQSCGM